MKPLCTLIITVLFSIINTAYGQVYKTLLDQHFTEEDMETAHTAKSVDYLTLNEKQVIQYMNLARIEPLKFAAFYKDYIEENDKEGYKKFRRKDKYYYGLYKDLMALPKKNLKVFTSSKEMYELAKCWALESGKRGLTGHNRKRCKEDYSAECCGYLESSDAMEHVLLLLIDDGIRSLGHRETMFDNYASVGVSIQDHKNYGKCSVLDFSD